MSSAQPLRSSFWAHWAPANQRPIPWLPVFAVNHRGECRKTSAKLRDHVLFKGHGMQKSGLIHELHKSTKAKGTEQVISWSVLRSIASTLKL